jgi:hypothetical protein
MSLTTKEAAQVRRNEFLAATNNPVDLQIMGLNGRAEVLRAAASQLDMNPSKIVPSPAIIKFKQLQMEQQQAQAAQTPGAPGEPGKPEGGGAPTGPAAGPPQQGPGQTLMNGAPQTDTFQPTPQGA